MRISRQRWRRFGCTVYMRGAIGRCCEAEDDGRHVVCPLRPIGEEANISSEALQHLRC